MNEESVHESNAPRKEEPLLSPKCPLNNLTAAHCIAAFIFAVTNMAFVDGWISVFALSMMFSQIQVASVIAALGSGPYWKRLAISQFSLLAVSLSYLGGTFVVRNMTGKGITVTFFPFEFLPMILVASAVSQMVFAIFRFTRGWRLHKKGTQRGPTNSLHDLFALTFFAAIILSSAIANLPTLGDSGLVFVPIGIISLLSALFHVVPTLLTNFKIKEPEQGCFIQLIIVVSIGFLVVMPFAAMGANMVVGPLLLVLVTCALTTWLPLAAMRETGYVLTNRKEQKASGDRGRSL